MKAARPGFIRRRFGPHRLRLRSAVIGIALLGALLFETRHVPGAGPSSGMPVDGQWISAGYHGSVTALLHVPSRQSTLLAATTNGIMRSTDLGDTWSKDGSGLEGHTVIALAGAAGLVWAGGIDGTVYAREQRRAGAVAWRRISPVLDADPSIGAFPVYSLAALSGGAHALIAGSQGAIYRGTLAGDGQSWRWTRVWHARLTEAGAAVTSVLAAPWDVNVVFASLFGSAHTVLRSGDGGRAWAALHPGPPASLPTQSLVAGAAGLRQIVLTTMGGGVWQQLGGGRWADISAGLPRRHAMPLLAGNLAGAHTYVAGTMGLGVYEKQGSGNWTQLGSGLRGASATVMGLAEIGGVPPVLVAATLGGIYRYTPRQ